MYPFVNLILNEFQKLLKDEYIVNTDKKQSHFDIYCKIEFQYDNERDLSQTF